MDVDGMLTDKKNLYMYNELRVDEPGDNSTVMGMMGIIINNSYE